MQLYAAGTSADQSAAMPLIASVIQSGTDGSFSITGSYTCPASDAPVYLTAGGGNPGEAAGTNNQASVLMASLGSCGSLSANTFIVINEVTTVASVYSLPQFMSSYTFVGASPADQALFVDQFARTNQFVNISTGTSPGPAVPSGYSVPTAELYSLANSLAACVNSAGGTAGDGSPCGMLFALATPPGGTAPTNTTDAALDIIAHPARNTAALFSLASPSAPFQPSLNSAPADWTLRISPNAPFALPERGALLGEYLLSEGVGAVAHDSSGLGNDGIITGPAWAWEGNMDLNFPAAGGTIQMPAALNAARSWQILFFNPPFGSATLPRMPGYGGPQSGFPNQSVLLCGSDMSHLCLFSNSLFTKSHRAYAHWSDQTEAALPLSTGWHVLSFLCGNQSGGVLTKTHILYDGTEVSSYLFQGDRDTCPSPTGGNFQFGGSSADVAAGFVGKLAGLWSWSSTLSVGKASSAAANALSLLQSRGVQTQFTDVTNTAPVILAGLDSRTAGSGVTPETVWLPQMVLDDPSYTRRNLAESGATAFDYCVMFDPIFGEQIGESAQPVITMFWGGVNDRDETGQQIADDLHCLVTKAKARGARVILATEISSYAGLTNAGDALKNAVDPILRAQAFSWGADNVADLATDPALGADGSSADTACFPDHLHPGPNCEPRITSIMQNAVNELLGSTGTAHHTTAAASYQELAGDDYLDLLGPGVQQVTLPSCIGYTLPRHINNQGAMSAPLLTLHGETLTGSSHVPPNAGVVLVPVAQDLSTGGCSWISRPAAVSLHD